MKLWIAPAGLHIKPANGDHVSKLAKIHQRGFFHGWKDNEFSSYLSRPHQTPIYVASDKKDRVAGFMVLRLIKEEAELLTIIVEPKWQGKGVGEALLRAGFDDLLASQTLAMFLEVDSNNEAAKALYHRFGFKQISERPGYYPLKDGTKATAIVMRTDMV
ncbi:MAG: ribosomal protein S18-alanine N-acetyltransferase [Devosiaceae bacterium]|nr:ribosomal protein S18-alanine N-acetyltransferase [Devosiaceae bacterium]